MKRSRVSALFLTVCFTGLVLEGSPKERVTSVKQIPERITWNGTNVSITCHITADSGVERIMVRWLKDNQTVVESEAINIQDNQSPVRIEATLNLLSIRLNHSAMFYCEAQMDLPKLEHAIYGNGTFVSVAPNLTTVTRPVHTSVTVEGPPNSYKDMLLWSLLSALVCVFLIICINCVLHKGYRRIKAGAKDAVVDGTHGSPCTDNYESVVYAALNIPRDSVKSTNENCAALAVTAEICTEESVTYSEVHIKKKTKDEG